MEGYAKKYHLAIGWSPINKANGGASDIISLKNYNVGEFYIMTGAALDTTTVTMHQGVSVSSCATTLAFTRYFESGCKLKYDGASTQIPAAAGEVATGATNTALGTVFSDSNGELVLYNRTNQLVYVDNEVLTFSGGKTAVVNGTLFDEDILVPRVATGDTFAMTTAVDINKIFMVPIHAAMLNSAARMDCVELNVALGAGASIMACFTVLSEPRYHNIPMPTAIYD
jgi:hypothetical protein